MANTLVEETERSIAGGRLAQQAELFLLIRADDGELAHLAFRLCHHALRNCHDALGKRIGKPFRIDGIVVLHYHASRLNLDVNLELGHIQLEQFLTDGLSSNRVLRQHAHLIGIGYSRTETIF